jgi:hypothetical protein
MPSVTFMVAILISFTRDVKVVNYQLSILLGGAFAFTIMFATIIALTLFRYILTKTNIYC